MKHMKSLKLLRAGKEGKGGAENYLLRLSMELEKQGIEHGIIHSTAPEYLSSWIKALLFNARACRVKNNDFYFSLERIVCADVYRAGDGVHKEFLKVKRRKLNPLNIVYLYLERKCFQNCQVIIANSNMIKKQIVDAYGIDSSKIAVIYNGINIKKSNYTHSFSKLSQEFDLCLRRKIILFVGSGFERKGVREFLVLISKLKEKNFHAFIVGKEKKMGYYKDIAKSLHIEKLVTFTGQRRDVDDFYTISDILLFPTKYEPFSNVVLEAMSFNNAVFTTKQNGAHEILEERYVLQTPEDLSIVPVVDCLLKNSQELERVKRINFSKIKNFTMEKNARETMAIVNNFLT